MAGLSTDEQKDFEWRRHSLNTWRENRREEGLVSPDFHRLISTLNPIFDYLAGTVIPMNMAMRVWCLLYVVRPDLIEYESFEMAGMRFGVSDESMRIYLKKLLKEIPDYKFVARPAVGPNSLEHRRRVQRRAALKKMGSRLDVPPEERDQILNETKAEIRSERGAKA